MAKTNEDYSYYHLPNSLQFAQQKIQFGLGNVNHGFKHISSLFMLNSLFDLPFFDHYLFNLPNLIFLVFVVLFCLIEVYYRSNLNSNISKIILKPIFHHRDQSYQAFKQEVADAASWGVLIKIYSG